MTTLPEPKLEFYRDENDATDLGGWRLEWGGYRIFLTSEHGKADQPYISLDRQEGDDDEDAILYPDGRIELGSYGTSTSFKDLHQCLAIKRAIRLLNSL